VGGHEGEKRGEKGTKKTIGGGAKKRVETRGGGELADARRGGEFRKKKKKTFVSVRGKKRGAS